MNNMIKISLGVIVVLLLMGGAVGVVLIALNNNSGNADKIRYGDMPDSFSTTAKTNPSKGYTRKDVDAFIYNCHQGILPALKKREHMAFYSPPEKQDDYAKAFCTCIIEGAQKKMTLNELFSHDNFYNYTESDGPEKMQAKKIISGLYSGCQNAESHHLDL